MSARRLTDKQRSSVVRLYRRGWSTVRIAKKFKAATSGINGLLRRRGVKMRSAAPKRIHQLWTPDRWNDGWIDNRGRFRVYRPDCPRAYASGYALRAHVVWWMAKGRAHSKSTELHHRDENKLNDIIGNLVPKPNRIHQRIHKSNDDSLGCRRCGRPFKRVHNRQRYTNTYCSRRCYNMRGKSK